jgi:transcriptional regulator with XRE-family HTH domain
MPWTWSPAKLRAARKDAGLSQAKLAERCRRLGYASFNPAQSWISVYEHGTCIPDADARLCMAEALGIPVQELHDFEPYPAAVMRRMGGAPWLRSKQTDSETVV